MADAVPTITPLAEFNERNCHVISWSLTQTSPVGVSIQMGGSSDRSVQIAGTADSSTTVLQGSNDGTNWKTLTDPQGNAISTATSLIEQVMELTRYIRPSSSGGGASQAMVVTLFLKKAK